MSACSFIGKAQPPKVVKPGQRPFDDVTPPAETGAVRFSRRCKKRPDPAFFHSPNVARNSIRTVTHQSIGARARPANRAFDGRNIIQKRKGFLGIVNIGRGSDYDQGGACCVRQQVAFAAIFRPVRGVRTCVVPPKTARTDAESTTPRRHSICPFSPNESRRN